VGAGAIAQGYAQAFQKCAVACLVAVADIRADAALALSQGIVVPAYESYESMAEEIQFDAVLVCTPPATHADISCYFLEREKHVLCEKPLSIDVQGALRMLEAATRSGVKLSMCSKFRFVDDVIRAKSIYASGVLGEIILFENVFTARVDMTSRWNSDPVVSGGGVLIDNGSHSVDLIRYFLGPITDVQVIEGKRVQRIPVEDTVRMFVRSAAGVMGSIDLSWSINKELESYINIYGSQGTVSVGWKQSRYRQASGLDWVVFGKGYDKLRAFRNQIENFAGAILGRELLLITARDAVASVQVIDAAYQAMRQQNWVTVGPEADFDAIVQAVQSRPGEEQR
jgi:predicted dehydrogenase